MTRFAGYAAVFDWPDEGGDVILPGAFARTLANGEAVPLLLQHKKGVVAGSIERLAEDGRGLQVIARIGDDATGEAAKRLMKQGKLNGLSFGYRVRRSWSEGGLRRLDDLDLVEVSLVARPMQPKARVHAIEE